MNIFRELVSLRFDEVAATFRAADILHQTAYVCGALGAAICLLLALGALLTGNFAAGFLLLLFTPVIMLIGAVFGYLLIAVIGMLILFALAAAAMAILT